MNRLDDQRLNPLCEKRQAGMDLSHPHDRVGDERHNTLFEERSRVKQGHGQVKGGDEECKGI